MIRNERCKFPTIWLTVLKSVDEIETYEETQF